MVKVHSRQKRIRGLNTHSGHYHFFHPGGKKRARTFKTEEAAHAWATKLGLKKAEYELKKVKKGKRLQITEKGDG